LTTSETLTIMKGHQDHIRSGAVSASSPDVWISGSYDHTVKLWDVRTSETINSFDHGAPVEDVLIYPTGSILVSAGGTQVKIWDLFKGKLVQELDIHQKTVTSLALDHTQSKLFTASLDQHVKILSTNTYQMVYSMRYSSPILCVAMSPAYTHLVTGMADGMLSIRHRAKPKKRTSKNMTPDGDDEIIEFDPTLKREDDTFNTKKKSKNIGRYLQDYDTYLKHFQYKKALDAALQLSNPAIVVSLCDELISRKALEIALSGRDELTVAPILTFLHEYIADYNFTKTLIIVFNCLLDLYAPVVGQSPDIDNMLKQIQRIVNNKVTLQKQLLETLGALDLLINSSNVVK